ncbi:hypothetical protein K438DRAFT_1767014 [Mycena galopus ATCC 62051]|nr:hypothetical protein K438DRAFT_1767014 [Mycena galopus ATCC 62051]
MSPCALFAVRRASMNQLVNGSASCSVLTPLGVDYPRLRLTLSLSTPRHEFQPPVVLHGVCVLDARNYEASPRTARLLPDAHANIHRPSRSTASAAPTPLGLLWRLWLSPEASSVMLATAPHLVRKPAPTATSRTVGKHKSAVALQLQRLHPRPSSPPNAPRATVGCGLLPGTGYSAVKSKPSHVRVDVPSLRVSSSFSRVLTYAGPSPPLACLPAFLPEFPRALLCSPPLRPQLANILLRRTAFSETSQLCACPPLCGPLSPRAIGGYGCPKDSTAFQRALQFAAVSMHSSSSLCLFASASLEVSSASSVSGFPALR